jgi:Na+/H+ antiporter NhaD/arsenite permease-like protein
MRAVQWTSFVATRKFFADSTRVSTAFGALIGGIGTPAGTAANLVAIAQLMPLANVDVSFLRWIRV